MNLLTETRMLLLPAALLFALSAWAPAEMAVNDTTSTWNTTQRQKKAPTIVLRRGESYPYTLTARNGKSPIDLSSTNAFVLWKINGSGESDYTNTYVVVTGTVINATNGTVRLYLSPRDTNLRPGYYNGYIDAYETDATNLIHKGSLQTQVLDIRYSPYLTDTNYLGPLPWGAEWEDELADAVSGLTGLIHSNAYDLTAREGVESNANDIAELSTTTNSILALLAAQSGLTSNLAAEASGRTAADTDLQAQINVLEVEGAVVTNVVCTGGPLYSDYFTINLQPWPYSVQSVSATKQADSIYYANEVYDTAEGYLLSENIIRQSVWTNMEYAAVTNVQVVQVVVTNRGPTGAYVTNASPALRWDSGLNVGATGLFTAVLGTMTREEAPVYCGASNICTNLVYKGDVPGSLRAYVNTSILAAAEASGKNMNVFDAGFVRNTNCWASAFDMTSASPYNTDNGTCKAGTLVTPQHIIYSTHYMAPIGTDFTFVDANNIQYVRTLIDQQCVDPECDWVKCDVTVGLLDAPLPESILPAQVLSAQDKSRFSGLLDVSGAPGLYGIRLNRLEEAGLVSLPIDQSYWLTHSLCPYRNADSVYSTNTVSGDSGDPIFFFAGPVPVLYLVTTSYGGGGNIPRVSDVVEQRMAEMGHSVYTNLTYVDLSSWTDYTTEPPTPSL